MVISSTKNGVTCQHMKNNYTIELIEKKECVSLLKNYHYLTGISRGFKSGINYGLFFDGVIVGVCIFTGFPM